MKIRNMYIIAIGVIVMLTGIIWTAVSPSTNSPVQAAGIQAFNFDDNKMPGSWTVSGDASIDTGKNHGNGQGGSLKITPGSSAVLNISKIDNIGKIEFWIYEDGTAPADPKAYRDGPLWGIKSADGIVQGIGLIYASYLSGENSYALGMSAEGKYFYRDVIYLGITRNKGWHKWTFVFDNAKGLSVFYDDRDINADKPIIIQDSIKARGFASIQLLGDNGSDNKQTIWVDDMTVDVTGPLKPSAEMESKVMKPIPVPVGGYYSKWPKNPLNNSGTFPIGVWLQDPARAAEYKAIGMNFYIGLWQGPTEEQLTALKNAGMPVICSQNQVGLNHLNDPYILAWTQDDELDNAQSDGKGGYGPPVLPEKVVERYNAMKAADPSRPIYTNFGQGVAWDNWYGRGDRTNKPEDYPEYVKGGDIISYDIYPVVTPDGEISGKLWKVPYGVDRLINWTEGKKPVWNCIECTRISNPNAKPTPAQVKAEIWMSIIHGSRGIVYFVHQFQEAGGFIEAALLADKEMSSAVGEINRQITELAPVLNTANIADGINITSNNKTVPVDVMAKKHGKFIYLFAVAMRNGETTATFTVKNMKGKHSIEVIGENRKIEMNEGKFSDIFKGFGVHLYKIQ